MGMYDEVSIRCPHCGQITVEQTKSGPCLLRCYSLESAPMAVLSGVVGDQHCTSCKKPYVIELVNKPIAIARKYHEHEDIP